MTEWSETKFWSEGDRVTTGTHGPGTVLGPEFWEDEKKWVFLRRWAVKLDFAHQFPWFDEGVAFFWDRDLLKEE